MKFLPEKIVIFLIMVVLSSCSSKKDILYFSDIKQGDKDKLELQENKIQLNDILDVMITSSNPELSVAYNSTIHTNASSNGYLVGNDGTITAFITSGSLPFDLYWSDNVNYQSVFCNILLSFLFLFM